MKNNFDCLEKQLDYKESISYDANGNISSYLRNGSTSAGKPQEMDRLAYYYNPGNNQLNYIHDTVPENNYTEDIDAQSMNNYTYDAIGNMTRDIKSGITDIQWNVYGKISRIVKSDNTTIDYAYDASGNRIRKTIGSHTTCYVRDAQGNVMSVYEAGNTALNNGNLTQTELHMYGSSRLGIIKATLDAVNGTATSAPPVSMPLLSTGNSYIFTRGYKFFELTNHLGNVLATVSDRKVQVGSGGSVEYYSADVVSAQDYYPFGMLQPGRSYNVGMYRYGFNGQERTNEIYDEGYTAEFWQYDARVGRRWNVDPVIKVDESPYAVFNNSPLILNDPDGDTPDKPKADGTKEGEQQTTSETTYASLHNAPKTTKIDWFWHAGSKDYNTKAGWYNAEDYQKVLTPIAADLAGYNGMYSSMAGYNWSKEDKEAVGFSKLGRFVGDGLSEGAATNLAIATKNYAFSRNFYVSGYTSASAVNAEDLLLVGAVVKGLAKVALAKTLGSAQSTSTFAHAFTSRLIGFRYALDPRVERVTFDLGYKKLLGGGNFKWGPRPDVGVLFKDGSVRVFEVMSKTDVEELLKLRNLRFMRRNSIMGDVKVVKPILFHLLYR
ncbi:RHS repeat domain-containing protein [Filimonas effusa]|uniref:RHS repeat-associated core domain-containing protein n=1 Tax=Filimonas effusa TaxID=2508721 RepID=A0A4Q1DB50_9BACT|nr:hypothetical protein [Filimonas effusa]RXK86138.1 hypothetical protein ESB13_04830 [Filimonas effusa]